MCDVNLLFEHNYFPLFVDSLVKGQVPLFRSVCYDFDAAVVVTSRCFLCSQAFPTKDGYLLVGAGNDGQFKVLCEVRQLARMCILSFF